MPFKQSYKCTLCCHKVNSSRAAVVHFNFRAESTFPVLNCTEPHGHGLIKQTINRTSRCNKVDAVRLYAPYRLNLLLLKGQGCVSFTCSWKINILSKMSLFPQHKCRVKFSLDSLKYIFSVKIVFQNFYILSKMSLCTQHNCRV